ncbi:DUF6318 family protein [Rothia mucilaginosa]|uniref:DUF6318 family protein n=1 Tax=Rothia mucilaginosa TaxID=43675 RepID=UPI0028E1DE9F|nr:DUF6318 family protein [Rothia mucilaginosa]
MTSPSPTSAGVSRRVALGATGAGVLAALTACASDIRPLADGSASSSPSASASASESTSASASASASASSRKSYKGFVKFDNFEKNGEYVPATAEKKAQNVPKPLVPANMNDQNVDGIYAFIGYWLASFNYALMTGDTEPMKKADPADVYVTDFQEFAYMYENDLGWMYGVDTPVTIELITGSPQKVSGSTTRYNWPAYMNDSPDAKIHREGKSDVPFKTASSPNGKLMKAIVEYKDGKWFMLTGDEDSSSKASDSSSSSSSV